MDTTLDIVTGDITPVLAMSFVSHSESSQVPHRSANSISLPAYDDRVSGLCRA